MIIPFNKPPFVGSESVYVLDSMKKNKISGDGYYGQQCQQWFEQNLPCIKALLTPSCTHALEMAAILINTQPGDEIIMPSYTFVSTANAFVLRGAKIVFVDIRPDTMNIDESKIESAITNNTKAIVPVHYAGISCEMDTILKVANKYHLYVIEDAAQGVMSYYKNKKLGTLGHLAAYSFHETKNYTSGGEGGALLINDSQFVERAEIIREKGTNRNQFFRGVIDKYTWTDIGSSYLPSELQAAYLWGQLEVADHIKQNRLTSWNKYYSGLYPLHDKKLIQLPTIPKNCLHNGHMFYIKVHNLKLRTKLIQYLNEYAIGAVFHYIPLHSSAFGQTISTFHGEDKFTTVESEKLIRLPLWLGMAEAEIQYVVEHIFNFFK